MEIIEYLKQAVETRASDVFIIAGGPVSMKVDGRIKAVSDEKLLPEVFFREIIDRKPDRAQIKEVLSRGIEVPGAALERGRSVMIG